MKFWKQRHRRLFQRETRAQTLIELVFVSMGVLAFLGLNLFLWGIFEVRQKQVALTRTQAFIELGNYSDYGYRAHGDDDLEEEESHLRFFLGENNVATRVDIESLEDFKKAVEGELDLGGGRGGGGDSSFWDSFGFPRAVTHMGKQLYFSSGVEPLDLQITLYDELFIAHNRSLNLTESRSEQSLPKNFATGSLAFSDWIRFSNQPLVPVEGGGLVDNRDIALRSLRNIVRADPSLAEEADRVSRSVNAADGLAGGAAAALVSTAISLAMDYGLNAISGAGGATGAVPGGGGLDAAGNSFGFPGFSAPNFIEQATLHNLGQGFTFASQIMNTASLGLALTGNLNSGFMNATAIVGGAGGVFSGLSSIQSFQTGMLGNTVVESGLKSQLFTGLSQVSGGASSIVGTFDPEAARVLGIASSAFGIAGTGFQIKERFDKPGVVDADGNLVSYKDYELDGNNNYVLDANGQRVSSFAEAGRSRLVRDIGGLVSQTGGLVQGIGGQELGLGLSVVGGGMMTAGGVGVMKYDLDAGNYKGEAWQLTADIGGLVSSASGVGVGLGQLTGNESMEKTFGYGMILGSSLGMAGSAGMLTEGLIRGDYEGFGENMVALGGVVSSVGGLGATVAATAGEEDLAQSLGMVSLVGGGIAGVGAVSLMGESIGDWMKVQGQKREGREAARDFIAQSGGDTNALVSRFQETRLELNQEALSGAGQKISPAFEEGYRAELGKTIKRNEPEVWNNLSGQSSGQNQPGNRSQESRPWNTARWNEETKKIAIWNEALQYGLNSALAVSTSAQSLSDFSSEPAFNPEALQQNPTTISQLSELYGSFSNIAKPTQITDAQWRIFRENQRVSETALRHVSESIARGERPEAELVAEGRRAAEANERLVRRFPTLRGEPQDLGPLYEMNSLLAQERATRLNFKAEVEVLSLMLQAERELVGKQVVAAAAEREKVEQLGKRHRDKIRTYRRSLPSHVDPIWKHRLEVAEKAWGNPKFISPREALQQIDRTTRETEERYQKMKSAITSVAKR